MKRIISFIMLYLITFGAIPISAIETNEEVMYDRMIEEGVLLNKGYIQTENWTSSSEIRPSTPENINNIVILIRFKGEEEYITLERSKEIESTYNQFVDNDNDKFSDLGSISLKSYINDLTYGNSTVNTKFYPKSLDGNSYISLEAPNTKEYYLNQYFGSYEEMEFIKWAFDSIKDEIELSAEELDINQDGQIDNVTFVINGIVLNNDNMLWPHKTVFQGNASIKGKKLGLYNIINSGSDQNNIFNKRLLSVITHEFLHSFNYPDLYRSYSMGSPIGKWDIMSNDIAQGQMPLIYSRNEYGNLGINIGEITKDGTYKLKSATSNNKEDILAFKIKSPLSEKEYFMVEFRKKQGNWDYSLPGSGLIVYRIDENVNSYKGNKYGSPDHIYIFRPGAKEPSGFGADIDQAFLSKEAGRTSIGDSNILPEFDGNSLYFQDGRNSGIEIYDIGSSSGEEITFKVKFPRENESPEIKGLTPITIREGKTVDLKLDVSAIDKEDGNLTDSIIFPKDDISRFGVGTYKIKYVVTDSAGNSTESERTIIVQDDEVKVTSEFGDDRYETAVRLSKSQFESADTVVIVNGEAIADGLTVTPLAAYKEAPILLTQANSLPQITVDEINRLRPRNIIITGGDGVIRETVVSSLRKMGIHNVVRLGGQTRYDTALEIAKYIDNNCYDVENVVVANGYGEADALSVASVAGRERMPIILVGTNLIHRNTESWLVNEKLKNAYIIGGNGVVSDTILNKINQMTSNNIFNNRLGGKTRFDTNAQVIGRFYGNKLDRVYITKGWELIDALSTGSIAAITNTPIVLVENKLTTEQKKVFEDKYGNRVIKVGGEVSTTAVFELRDLLK